MSLNSSGRIERSSDHCGDLALLRRDAVEHRDGVAEDGNAFTLPVIEMAEPELFVDQRQLHRGDCANFDEGRSVLLNREVQAVIIENSCQQILTEGLAYERCEVGIITNICDEAESGHPI